MSILLEVEEIVQSHTHHIFEVTPISPTFALDSFT
jgi:hypothetical protein